MKAFKILHNIINNFEKSEDEITNYRYKSINRYLLLLFSVFLIHFISITILWGSDTLMYIHGFLLVYYILMLILKKKKYVLNMNIEFYIFTSYLLLISTVAFISVYTNFNLHIEIYIFPILSSIPFFYNIKNNKPQIFILITICFIMFITPNYLTINFINKSEVYTYKNQDLVIQLRKINFLMCLITSLINIYFVFEKNEQVLKLSFENINFSNEIKNLELKYATLMKNQLSKNNISNNEIEEIYALANSNSSIYFDKFCYLFPNFKTDLYILNPNLNFNELYFCSLIKLNYDTKKIAQILNITVRAVESKKYRLKKKLNININENIHEFVMKI